MINRQPLEIKRKKWLSDTVFGLEFYLPGIDPRPGQFFQVRVQDGHDPFLNRPISIASYNRDKLRLVIRVQGRGTKVLSEKKEGDRLLLFGPYGNGVKVARKKSLLLAGGIGIAPLYFLAQNLYENRIQFSVLYGTKTPSEIILKTNIIKISNESIFVTESGSGRHATALSALREIDISEYEVLYTCGPRAMLKELQAFGLSLPVYAFCEDFLGCGCGLCLGCAIKYRGEYKRICEDGPVFELSKIDFESRSQ
jgi:dihydroorotate dehydrogenase electron transfer subunit